MTESIGRRSIRNTLENLKSHVNFKLAKIKHDREFLDGGFKTFKDKMIEDPEERILAIAIKTYINSVDDLINTFSLYIESLESYLSELDETFDSLLEEAVRKAEQRIREIPKERPPFYE